MINWTRGGKRVGSLPKPLPINGPQSQPKRRGQPPRHVNTIENLGAPVWDKSDPSQVFPILEEGYSFRVNPIEPVELEVEPPIMAAAKSLRDYWTPVQSPFVPAQPNCKRKDNVACVTPRENVPKRVLLSNKMGYSPGTAKTEETDEDSSMHAKRSVGRFFYENGIDFSVVKSPSFLKMISAAIRIRSVRPSLTLENIVLEKENLQKMFGPSAWNTSMWALRADGKRVADLIERLSFWSEATKVLKATILLVRVVHLVNGGDSKPQMGYIYETMDQVKETIKEEFENKKVSYMPFWKILDGIWSNILHRPIHAVGYFLNPSLFYYDDFVVDAETCSGALRYGLQKNLSEELHKIGRNNIEQQRLLDITFVHHNLRLRDCESNTKEGDGDSDEMIGPMDDWIVDEAVNPPSSVDSVAWMDSNTIDNEEEPSTIQPKKEQ
ncbi:hypothetical protein GIB67_011632 [Kingdonia uniflora]|uniref:Uncharacterized protein n=1 Tax=Kingdonia uniflora TaxID=39325 RepID=A0A7J7NM19_9MAGN|nr:hypothetical protein GIB67_011632 [Kingdonia uniflora]